MGGEESKSKKIDGKAKQIMAATDEGRTEYDKPLLNARQQDLLRKSWRHSSGSDSVGVRIFKKIFATEPAIARIFGLDGVADQDLAYNPMFQPHADRFTKALAFVISNLDSKEKISQHAQALGASHVKFESRGFKMAYWDVFAEAMTECAIDWESNIHYHEAMHAWRLLVTFYIEEMRSGYQRERRRNSNHSVLSYKGGTSTSTVID